MSKKVTVAWRDAQFRMGMKDHPQYERPEVVLNPDYPDGPSGGLPFIARWYVRIGEKVVYGAQALTDAHDFDMIKFVDQLHDNMQRELSRRGDK